MPVYIYILDYMAFLEAFRIRVRHLLLTIYDCMVDCRLDSSVFSYVIEVVVHAASQQKIVSRIVWALKCLQPKTTI